MPPTGHDHTPVRYPTGLDYVYSWRTRLSQADVLGRSLPGNSVGIALPRKKGGAFELVADRKRFTEDIMRTMNAPSHNGATQKNVCSATDLGHPFVSVKHRTVRAGEMTVAYPRGGWSWPPGTVLTAPYFAMAYPHVGQLAQQLPFASQPVQGAPSNLQIRDRMNRVFADMLPGKETAQIGETLVSLLRGDLPTLFQRIGKTIRKLSTKPSAKAFKGVAKASGSEYLGVVFGWEPLIADINSAIKTLLTIDRLIYGTGYRRKRSINFATWSPPLDRNHIGPRSSVSVPGTREMSPVPLGSSQFEYDTTAKLDVRLSARLVPFARPGIGANKFADEAYDVMERLGVWYPALGWDLLPYSWLIDWFSHLGSAITNSQRYGSQPGMISIDYAWATTQTSILVTQGPLKPGALHRYGSSDVYVNTSASSITITKKREGASPFGFGLDLSALRANQVSVLVALGLVKLP